MSWLDAQHIELGGMRISLASLLLAAAILVVGFILASRISARFGRARDGEAVPPRWRLTVARVAGHTLRLLAISFALQTAGIDIGSLLAAGAVLAVGIGIAMQKVAENFVSGIILMAERSIREGDVIEFDERIVRVRQIGIRSTRALTLDDEEIIVPNSMLVQSAVKNLTLTDPSCRIRVQVGVSYESDLAVVEEALAASATAIEWRDERMAPTVFLVGFGASSVDFEVSVWTRDAWGIPARKSALRMVVWRALQAADVTIPFPQLDLHLDTQPAKAT